MNYKYLKESYIINFNMEDNIDLVGPMSLNMSNVPSATSVGGSNISDYVVNLYQYETINNDPSHHVQNITSYHKPNLESKKVSNIYFKLTNLIDDIPEDYTQEEDDEIIKHKKIITCFHQSIVDFIAKLNEQKEKTLSKEKDFKISYQKIKSDVDKLKDFSNFMTTIDNKYTDVVFENINKSILDASEKISDNNNHEEIKKQFIKQNYIYSLYIDSIKSINSFNSGNTCSLCLQRPVDTFMEPCGHTGCSECIKMLQSRNGEFNCNCFLCRKSIFKFHKLYFT